MNMIVHLDLTRMFACLHKLKTPTIGNAVRGTQLLRVESETGVIRLLTNVCDSIGELAVLRVESETGVIRLLTNSSIALAS